MTRSRAVLIALIPGGLVVLALAWLVRKIGAWRAEEDRKLSGAWLTEHAAASALSEFQGSLDEPKPWARPRRVSDGPTSIYTRAAR